MLFTSIHFDVTATRGTFQIDKRVKIKNSELWKNERSLMYWLYSAHVTSCHCCDGQNNCGRTAYNVNDVWITSWIVKDYFHYFSFQICVIKSEWFFTFNLWFCSWYSNMIPLFVGWFPPSWWGPNHYNHIWPHVSMLSQSVIKFNGLSRIADSEVHVIFISRVIITYALESLFSSPK